MCKHFANYCGHYRDILSMDCALRHLTSVLRKETIYTILSMGKELFIRIIAIQD